MNLAPRERRLLLALAGLGGVAVLRLLWTLLAPQALPALKPATAAAARSAGATSAKFGKGSRQAEAELPKEIVELRVADLESQPRALSVGRDPFRFGPPPPPPPPPPPTKAELEEMRRQEQARREAAERAAREAMIRKPPPVTVVYLGSFGPEKRRIAVFADDKGENLYNVLVGEIVEGKFIVDRIGYESVDIKFVGFPDEPARRLPIGG
ncbi:MAG: hypothetical protein ABI689_17770 [Thermoanaerobaculia bacterium]